MIFPANRKTKDYIIGHVCPSWPKLSTRIKFGHFSLEILRLQKYTLNCTLNFDTFEDELA